MQVQKNVLSMNALLFSLCSRYKLFYIDAFRLFVDNFGCRILNLFPKVEKNEKLDIHPDKKGMGVMARNIIFLIHSNWFNPLGY